MRTPCHLRFHNHCLDGLPFDQRQLLAVLVAHVFHFNGVYPNPDNPVTVRDNLPFGGDKNVLAIGQKNLLLFRRSIGGKPIVLQIDGRRRGRRRSVFRFLEPYKLSKSRDLKVSYVNGKSKNP